MGWCLMSVLFGARVCCFPLVGVRFVCFDRLGLDLFLDFELAVFERVCWCLLFITTY